MNLDLARARAHLLRAREQILRRRGDHREGEEELLAVREADPTDAAAAEGGAIPLDSLNETERGQVEEIDQALHRIAAGEYGTCEVCGGPIEERRLEVLPWARRCFADETEFEREHRSAHTV
jgi:DnaK suppressor protein